MVRTDPDIDNLPPEERLKELERARKQKAEELEALLKEKEEEMRRAEEELEFHKRRAEAEEAEESRKAEEDELKKKNTTELEDVIREEEEPEEQPRDEGGPVYLSPLERIPAPVYELTNYNVYRELVGIESRIEQRGYATNDEQARINQFRAQSDIIKNTYSINQLKSMDTSRNNYLSRTEGVLARLDQKLHDISTDTGVNNIGHVYKQ